MVNQLSPTIIWENEQILALDKPAGLRVHSDSHHRDWSLADWLLKHYPNLKTVGEPAIDATGAPVPRPGLVHRLDKDTSGLILVAKDQASFLFLKRQFQKHQIIKHYRLLVYGRVKEDHSTINYAIGRSRQDPRRRSAGPGAVGERREAQTTYQVLERLGDYTYLEAAPQTGRTHQLRVHFLTIGHPIVGDQLYAPHRPSLPTLHRQALHAYWLRFRLPGPNPEAGEIKELTAPLPSDFQTALEQLRRPC